MEVGNGGGWVFIATERVLPATPNCTNSGEYDTLQKRIKAQVKQSSIKAINLVLWRQELGSGSFAYLHLTRMPTQMRLSAAIRQCRSPALPRKLVSTPPPLHSGLFQSFCLERSVCFAHFEVHVNVAVNWPIYEMLEMSRFLTSNGSWSSLSNTPLSGAICKALHAGP